MCVMCVCMYVYIYVHIHTHTHNDQLGKHGPGVLARATSAVAMA